MINRLLIVRNFPGLGVRYLSLDTQRRATWKVEPHLADDFAAPARWGDDADSVAARYGGELVWES